MDSPLFSQSGAVRSLTYCQHWRDVLTFQAAGKLGLQFRVDMELRPLTSSIFPGHDRCYHASLTGQISLSHLKFILQHPDLVGADFDRKFGSEVAEQFLDKLQEVSSNTTQVVMLTLKLYHSRQAGFTDEELDKLGSIFKFKFIPSEISCYLRSSDFTPLILICEPVWQLLSPAKHVNYMPWEMQDECVRYVAELPEVCGE